MDVIERMIAEYVTVGAKASGVEFEPHEAKQLIDETLADGAIKAGMEAAYRIAFAHIAEITPTKAMLDAVMEAANDAMDTDYDGDGESYSYLRSDAPHMIWKAMATAMLAEKELK